MESCAENAAKRVRSANFTNEEKIVLLDIVNQYKNVLECKKTDATSWREKDKTWDVVTREFNASSPVMINRTKENLKKCYDNKKKETRKKAAEQRRNCTQTGGGPSSCKDTGDPTFDLTLSILNEKTVYGLHNIHDSDNIRSDQENVISEDIMLVVEEDPENHEEPGSSLDWGNYKPGHLQTPLSTPLQIQSTRLSANCKEKSSAKQKEWNCRRRPVVNATSYQLAKQYEELAEAKTNLVKLQMSIIKKQEEHETQKIHDREVNRDREDELYRLKIGREQREHELRVEIMQLDIELKRAQLAKLTAS